MTKDKSKKAGKAKAPKALRASADAVAEWTKSPLAREILAAGLIAVAGALADSKAVRARVKGGAKDIGDAAEATSRLGAAIAAAASDAAGRLFPADDAPPAPKKAAKKGGKKRKPSAAPPIVVN